MKYILILLSAIVLSVPTCAQVSHLGILYSSANSDHADGNGAIQGFAVQGKHDISQVEGLSAVGELKFTRDYKGYLQETGKAFRTRLLARYEYRQIFAQAGLYYGHIRFQDTSPTIRNGYGKSILQPVVGFGYHYNAYEGFDLTADYLYFVNGRLHATDSDGHPLGIDGTSRTHRIGFNSSYEFAPKWLVLANLSWDRNTYTRQCGYYSADICGIPNRSDKWEVGIGLGRKF